MRCEQARHRIGMLVDGELPTREHGTVMAHAASCPDCAGYRDDLARLRRHLRRVREPVPTKLADRLTAALAVEALEDGPEAPVLPIGPRAAPVTQAPVLYLRRAMVVLLACAISMAGTAWWMQRSNGEAALSHDVLTAHIRSLLQDNPVQVASYDTHTVKPWFAGRLDYSPAVKDLSTEGFRLIGGRLDYIDGRRVAALVYSRRLHRISVFVWPSGSNTIMPHSAKVDGFNLLGWAKGGMSYWIVSDLNERELRELQGLL